MPSPESSVVIVNYNSGSHLARCLESLAAVPPPWPLEILVVDNASEDDSLEAARRAGVRVHESGRNAGFGAGCNQGWRLAAAPRVLFLNPDARVGAGTLERACAALDARSDVAMVGLGLVDVDGRWLPGWGREPGFWAEAWQKYVWNRPAWAALRYARAREVDWVSGAAMLCRREVLERLDGFDEGYFLYFEDVDLCRRARDEGWRIWYEAGARVIHEGGGCGRVPLRTQRMGPFAHAKGSDAGARRRWLREGRRRYREKFRGVEF